MQPLKNERKTIALPRHGIILELSFTTTDFGLSVGGVITSDLHEETPESVEGGSEEDQSFDAYNSAIDGLEALILAHACAGINVEDPKYLTGIDTAVEAICNESGP